MKKSKFTALVLTLVMLLGMLSGCGKSNPFIGTFGGTASSGKKVEITINKDNTVIYTSGSSTYEGVWSEYGDNSIELDFGGKVFSRYEPLIVTLSTDGNVITVDSASSGWTADFYQRR